MSSAQEQAIPQSSHWLDSNIMQKLPNVLRFLGASSLIIAMYSFLVNGWQSGNDVLRYLLMLGHTTLLAGVGLMSGHWLKEGKGARLLLTLALVSIPANFAILGAFVYSQTVVVKANLFPHYFYWSVGSLNTAVMLTIGAMLLLIPISLLGFTVLARGMSRHLTTIFLLGNAALLLPMRDPTTMGVVVIALAISIAYFSSRVARDKTAAKTFEGITALGLQLLPVAVLLGRSLWLHSGEVFVSAVMCITIFIALRQLSMYFVQDSNLHKLLNAVSFLPAVMTAPLLGKTLFDAFHVGFELVVPICATLVATMVFDIAHRTRANREFYHGLANAILLISMMANLLLYQNFLAAIVNVIVGLVMIHIAFKIHRMRTFGAGVILVTAGVINQLLTLIHHFDLSSWIVLAALGLSAIVIASTIEAKGGAVRARFKAFKQQFES